MSTISSMSPDKNYMVVIRPGAFNVHVEELESVPKLEKLKWGLNGGLLEIVPFFNKFMGRTCIAFCDEEGKNKGLMPNERAQALWDKVYPVYGRDYLVGPIVIIIGSQGFLARL